MPSSWRHDPRVRCGPLFNPLSSGTTKGARMQGSHTLRTRLLGSALAASLALSVSLASAQSLTPVPAANPKIPGVSAPNVLSVELDQVLRATGSMLLENPQSPAKYYGYNDDRPNLVPIPGVVPAVEAHKTEPDKNTYLVLKNQQGPDPNYDYGTHFLFQGHESGPGTFPNQQGYVTRINLDADVAHRVTLMATKDVNGTPLPVFDGSTWYPWANRLLFTAELGNIGGVWQATLDVPSAVEDISGAVGRAGYEGIQPDSAGALWIVEDSGGTFGTTNSHARRPNSFVYRFIPYDKTNLKEGGKLQVLAVQSKAHTGDIVFDPAQTADDAILSQDVADLHTYGLRFDTRWITIHDTAVDGSTPYDANALAKAKGGTPFKRPENGMFRPAMKFQQFFFTETGDTSALTEAHSDHGGFGALFMLQQERPTDNHGTLSLFFRGDVAHTGLDNLAFLTKDHLIAVEDAGDTLHTQRNALDSAYLFDVRADYSNPANKPMRILAQGRDASATIDASSSALGNDGDNEITGIHVSDGDPTTDGLLGTKKPNLFHDGWRLFYTKQHGDNVTFEIIPAQ